ncbi:hypothetical protein HMPREF3069_05070 [Achromobacter xylosoxidans]|nr:hypothetical protein HMPREF3069_05070 [Achromobacter xylosoxidans]
MSMFDIVNPSDCSAQNFLRSRIPLVARDRTISILRPSRYELRHRAWIEHQRDIPEYPILARKWIDVICRHGQTEVLRLIGAPRVLDVLVMRGQPVQQGLSVLTLLARSRLQGNKNCPLQMDYVGGRQPWDKHHQSLTCRDLAKVMPCVTQVVYRCQILWQHIRMVVIEIVDLLAIAKEPAVHAASVLSRWRVAGHCIGVRRP